MLKYLFCRAFDIFSGIWTCFFLMFVPIWILDIEVIHISLPQFIAFFVLRMLYGPLFARIFVGLDSAHDTSALKGLIMAVAGPLAALLFVWGLPQIEYKLFFLKPFYAAMGWKSIVLMFWLALLGWLCHKLIIKNKNDMTISEAWHILHQPKVKALHIKIPNLGSPRS